MSTFNFYYSAMGAGKSATLINKLYNYEQENGKQVLTFNYSNNNRDGIGFVASRIGNRVKAIEFNETTNFLEYAKNLFAIFIDEAQFLTKQQVLQLAKLVDVFNIEINCFGLRTDFRGELFEGSGALLGLADKLIEIPSIDKFGDSATMQIRVDKNGERVRTGPQKEIGFHYLPVSRKSFYNEEENMLC